MPRESRGKTTFEPTDISTAQNLVPLRQDKRLIITTWRDGTYGMVDSWHGTGRMGWLIHGMGWLIHGQELLRAYVNRAKTLPLNGHKHKQRLHVKNESKSFYLYFWNRVVYRTANYCSFQVRGFDSVTFQQCLFTLLVPQSRFGEKLLRI